MRLDSRNRIALPVETSQTDGTISDSAGNMTAQPGLSATFNAENQMTGAGGVTYIYDGDGKRVKKSSGKLYWYGIGTDPLSETDLSGNATDDYIFFNGQRIARQNISSGTRYFYFSDHLGTTRAIAQMGVSSSCYDADFYPFGGEAVIATNTCAQNYKFTGKERDAESGLDYFEARHYAGALGRFMQPDEFPGGPVDLFEIDDPTSQALPYADINDPQSLNKYAYTYNNPLRYTDPDGHCPWCIGAAIGAGAGFAGSIIVQKWQHPDQPINWKSVGAATVGGAVSGATLGLAAPATITTLGGAAVVSTAGIGETAAVGAAGGVAGGIAERTIENNGDINKATENPNAMVRDAVVGAGTEVVSKGVGAVVDQVAGGAVRAAESNVQRLTPRSPAKLVEKRMGRLERAQTALERQKTRAEVATQTGAVVTDSKTKKDKD